MPKDHRCDRPKNFSNIKFFSKYQRTLREFSHFPPVSIYGVRDLYLLQATRLNRISTMNFRNCELLWPATICKLWSATIFKSGVYIESYLNTPSTNLGCEHIFSTQSDSLSPHFQLISTLFDSLRLTSTHFDSLSTHFDSLLLTKKNSKKILIGVFDSLSSFVSKNNSSAP